MGNPQTKEGQESCIRLGQFLKLTGEVGTGGEGKLLILDGLVAVNGEVSLQRGRHLFPSDVVTIRGRSFRVADFV